MAIGPNVTGWAELMDGNMIAASFVMYDTAMWGMVVGLLFIVYQIMLYFKTGNLTLCWVTGIIFASMYITSEILNPIVHPISVYIIWLILGFELTGILFMTFFK